MKLIVADDHALFRDALVHYIERAESDAEIVQVSDLHGVIDGVEGGFQPDLILLDLRMPGMNGIAGLKTIRQTYPDIPVVLLSGLAETAEVQDAMRLGARGYFPKTMSGKMMMQGMRRIIAGEDFIPVDYNTQKMMPSYYGEPRSETISASPPPVDLTRREREVLGYLLRGASNKEIARALDVQVVTVKLHVRGLCRKLGAANRTQAALKAQKIGLS